MNKNNSKSILIFGGSFNPPTLAHQAVIEACLNLDRFSELWLMPSGDRVDKQMHINDDERLAMLNILIREEFGGDPRLKVTDFELKLPIPTETYRTVYELERAYKGIDFWFAFGVDSFETMPNWGEGLRLQSSLNMVIVDRDGIMPPVKKNIIPLGQNKFGGISSSKVRAAVKSGLTIEEMVPDSILRFIFENNLYQA